MYAALGRRDDAFACLEAPVGQGLLHLDWVANDPDLDALRDSPRFEALLETARERCR